MSLFVTSDRKHYQLWINLFPSFFVPGASQFFSGRRRTGLGWLLLFLGLKGLEYAVMLHPSWVLRQYVYLAAASGIIALWLIMMADAFRTPIPRMGIKGWVLLVGATSLISTSYWLIDQFVVTDYHVPTGSMHPTLRGIETSADGYLLLGDRVYVNKLVYRLREPRRGEVVIFDSTGMKHPKMKKGVFYLKRIVGLPGETVTLVPPHVYINGEKLTDPPVFEKICGGEDGYQGFQYAAGSLLTPAVLSKPTDRVVLNDDEYLVLGDNTLSSLDGRYHGPIVRTQIAGRVTKVHRPFERVGVVE